MLNRRSNRWSFGEQNAAWFPGGSYEYGIYWFGGWKLEAFDTRGKKKIRNLHLIMWKPSRIVEIYFWAFCPADTVTHVPASHSWCMNLEGSLIFSQDWGIFLKSPDSWETCPAWWFSLIMSLKNEWRGSSSLVFLQRYKNWTHAWNLRHFSILIDSAYDMPIACCGCWPRTNHDSWGCLYLFYQQSFCSFATISLPFWVMLQPAHWI